MLTEEVTLVHECRSLDSMSSSLPRYPRTPRRPRRRARSTPTLDSVVSRVSQSIVSSYDYVLNLSVRSSASYALNKGTRRRRVPPEVTGFIISSTRSERQRVPGQLEFSLQGLSVDSNGRPRRGHDGDVRMIVCCAFTASAS